MNLKVLYKPDNDFWEEFDVLAEESCYFTVNLNSIWLKNYINHYLQPHQKPYILTAYNGNELVGCLPLQTSTVRGTRFFNFTKLEILGFGPTDFYDIPLKSGFEKKVLYKMVHHLKKSNEWDKCALTDIPKRSKGLLEFKEALEQHKMSFKEDSPNGFMYINTKNLDADKFLNKKFYPQNKDLAKAERRIKKQDFKLEFIHHKTNVYKNLIENIEFYAQRRKSLGQFNNYETNKLKQFLKNIIEEFEEQEKVELTLLKSNNEVWAFQLDWISNRTRYHWNHAYNEKYKRYSPGKIILKQLLLNSIDNPNIYSCNHMRGLSPYKRKFTENQEYMSRIEIENPSSIKLKLTKIISTFLKLIYRK